MKLVKVHTSWPGHHGYSKKGGGGGGGGGRKIGEEWMNLLGRYVAAKLYRKVVGFVTRALVIRDIVKE